MHEHMEPDKNGLKINFKKVDELKNSINIKLLIKAKGGETIEGENPERLTFTQSGKTFSLGMAFRYGFNDPYP